MIQKKWKIREAETLESRQAKETKSKKKKERKGKRFFEKIIWILNTWQSLDHHSLGCRFEPANPASHSTGFTPLFFCLEISAAWLANPDFVFSCNFDFVPQYFHFRCCIVTVFHCYTLTLLGSWSHFQWHFARGAWQTGGMANCIFSKTYAPLELRCDLRPWKACTGTELYEKTCIYISMSEQFEVGKCFGWSFASTKCLPIKMEPGRK